MYNGEGLYNLYLLVFKLVFPTQFYDLPEKSQEDWNEFARGVNENRN